MKKGGLTKIAEGSIPLDHGVDTVMAALPQSGALLVQVKGGTANGALKGAAGAVVVPEKIR